jgi:hypothetical protein
VRSSLWDRIKLACELVRLNDTSRQAWAERVLRDRVVKISSRQMITQDQIVFSDPVALTSRVVGELLSNIFDEVREKRYYVQFESDQPRERTKIYGIDVYILKK